VASQRQVTPQRPNSDTFAKFSRWPLFGNSVRIRPLAITPDSAMTDHMSVTDINKINGLTQTTNLGVGSSNLSGRAILLHYQDIF